MLGESLWFCKGVFHEIHKEIGDPFKNEIEKERVHEISQQSEELIRTLQVGNLMEVRLIALDMGALVAGAGCMGNFEDRVKSVCEDVEKTQGRVILFIDKLHLVLGSHVDNLFTQMLARGQLKCVGVTTFDEYNKCVEKDSEFRRHFQQVRKEVTNLRDAIIPLKIQLESGKERGNEIRRLKQQQEELMSTLQVAESQMDVATITDLRYGALEEIDAAIARCETNAEFVGPHQIAEVVTRWTGIPVNRLMRTDKERLLGLAERLHETVVGQGEAVKAVADALVRSKTGLGRAHKTTGSFLFLGPTGVGQTELAKALAEQLFDDKNLLVQIDMSEYTEQHSVSRLIGAPPGYEEGGKLTDTVRRRPYCVVLFSEVEKAHVSVLDIILQMLANGRLTDGHGRTVDFSSTVIIMTTILGSENLLAGPGRRCIQAGQARLMQQVRKHIRPQLLESLDEIVIFNPLRTEELREVVRSHMKDATELLARRGVTLIVSDAALDLLLAEDCGPVYGSRPLSHWVDRKIVSPLSQMLLTGEIDEKSTVFIDALPGESSLSYRVEQWRTGKSNHCIEIRSGIMEKKRTEEVEEDMSIEENVST